MSDETQKSLKERFKQKWNEFLEQINILSNISRVGFEYGKKLGTKKEQTDVLYDTKQTIQMSEYSKTPIQDGERKDLSL